MIWIEKRTSRFVQIQCEEEEEFRSNLAAKLSIDRMVWMCNFKEWKKNWEGMRWHISNREVWTSSVST